MAWLRDPSARALPGFLSALGGVGRIPSPFGPPVPRALFAAGRRRGGARPPGALRATRDDAPAGSPRVFVFLVARAVAGGLGLAARRVRRPQRDGRARRLDLGGRARGGRRGRGVRAAAGVRRRGAGLAATLFVVVGPASALDDRAAVGSLARLARPGDAVLAGPGFYLPARLRGRPRAARGARRSASLGDAAHPGLVRRLAAASEPDVRAELSRLAAGPPPGARLFAVPPAYDTRPR